MIIGKVLRLDKAIRILVDCNGLIITERVHSYVEHALMVLYDKFHTYCANSVITVSTVLL